MQDYRLNSEPFTSWRRRGYLLSAPDLGVTSTVWGVTASAPGCREFYLRMIVQDTTILSIQLLRHPARFKRNWQPVPALEDHPAWQSVPAAWFKGTVLQLLREAESEDKSKDEGKDKQRAAT